MNQTSPSPTRTPTMPTARLGTILVADDDDLFREGLAAHLRKEGYECHCAESGEQAAVLLRSPIHFETLISDIYMPGNIGLELIQELPQLAAGLPVILLTGRPSVQSAVIAHKLSVAGYLIKPPDWSELLELLRDSVAKHRGQPTAPPPEPTDQ